MQSGRSDIHADLHPGNFLLLPGGRLGMLDFGAVAATRGCHLAYSPGFRGGILRAQLRRTGGPLRHASAMAPAKPGR